MPQNKTHAVMARAEARTQGFLWYFTGQPCRRGHIAKRNVSNCECRGCVNVRAKRYREEDPERVRGKERRRYWKNVQKKRRQMNASRQRHLEKRRAEDRTRYHANPEPRKKQATAWARNHRVERNEIVARSRARRRKATPPWLTDDQRCQIKAFYELAASMPTPHHVDHIVPLRGRTVCGLDVPWNLQVIPADDNRRKSNYHAE